MITNSYNLIVFYPKTLILCKNLAKKPVLSEKMTNSNLRKADSLQAAVVADYHPALRHSSLSLQSHHLPQQVLLQHPADPGIG